MTDECNCGSCTETRRLKAGGKCRCCDGKGTVPAIDGSTRPCSRCQDEAFSAWTRHRRCEALPACAVKAAP